MYRKWLFRRTSVSFRKHLVWERERDGDRNRSAYAKWECLYSEIGKFRQLGIQFRLEQLLKSLHRPRVRTDYRSRKKLLPWMTNWISSDNSNLIQKMHLNVRIFRSTSMWPVLISSNLSNCSQWIEMLSERAHRTVLDKQVPTKLRLREIVAQRQLCI